MAALAVQTERPIAGFQPVDHDVLQAFAIGNQKAIVNGDQKVDYFISAKELEIAWGNDPRYWKYTNENGIHVAELIFVYWLEVKGKMAVNTLQSVPREGYSASFIVQRTSRAMNLNNIKLKLELKNGKPAKERVVDLTEIPADTWVALNIADLTAQGDELVVYLTDTTNKGKKGLKIAGVIIHPISS